MMNHHSLLLQLERLSGECFMFRMQWDRAERENKELKKRLEQKEIEKQIALVSLKEMRKANERLITEKRFELTHTKIQHNAEMKKMEMQLKDQKVRWLFKSWCSSWGPLSLGSIGNCLNFSFFGNSYLAIIHWEKFRWWSKLQAKANDVFAHFKIKRTFCSSCLKKLFPKLPLQARFPVVFLLVPKISITRLILCLEKLFGPISWVLSFNATKILSIMLNTSS